MTREIARKSTEESTKQRILQAALAIIGRDGMHKLTIRNIAAEAQVNIASIHYHFQSKENIVREVILIQFSGFDALVSLLEDESVSPVLRLFNFFDAFMAKMLDVSGMMASQMEVLSGAGKKPVRPPAFMLPPLNDEDGNSLFSRITRQFALIGAAVANVISLATGIQDEECVKFKTVQAMLSVNHPFLMSGHSSLLLGFDIRDDELRKRYIQSVIDSIIGIQVQ